MRLSLFHELLMGKKPALFIVHYFFRILLQIGCWQFILSFNKLINMIFLFGVAVFVCDYYVPPSIEPVKVDKIFL